MGHKTIKEKSTKVKLINYELNVDGLKMSLVNKLGTEVYKAKLCAKDLDGLRGLIIKMHHAKKRDVVSSVIRQHMKGIIGNNGLVIVGLNSLILKV